MEILDVAIIALVVLLIIANWEDIKPRNGGGKE